MEDEGESTGIKKRTKYHNDSPSCYRSAITTLLITITITILIPPLHTPPQPVLYTIPGSGNTMTRLLIDAVLTGYHSTSVYGDHSLASSLPGWPPGGCFVRHFGLLLWH